VVVGVGAPPCGVIWFWLVVLAALGSLLLVAWRMDRAVRRRGSRVLHHADVWRDVRDSRRDVEATNPFSNDNSWSSWSRRNRR
jgi:hypothetical protein